jgi:hypothetical protein
MGRSIKYEVGGLIVAVIAGIYFPVASHYHLFPFKAKPVAMAPNLTSQGVTIDDGIGKFPILDVKVLNEGSQTAVLNKAVLTIDTIWKLTPQNTLLLKALPVSAEHEVNLTMNRELPSNGYVPINISIKEKDADRFTFMLKHDLSGTNDVVVRLSIKLIYNHAMPLEINNLIFIARRPGIMGNYNIYNHPNVETARELKELRGTKSEGLEKLISQILKQ